MNTDIWRKLWAFLNQPLFEQNSVAVKQDLKLLERCWNKPPDLQLLERCWDKPLIQEIQPDLHLLERCWNKPSIQSKYDR